MDVCSSMALLVLHFVLVVAAGSAAATARFSIEEASVQGIQEAFKTGSLTSKSLVQFYIERVGLLNPQLRAIIEVNPDALSLAEAADSERAAAGGYIGDLHGIPVLLKDNIATADKLNTTAGSFALLGSKVPRDAGIVSKLRRAGAIIFGKANLSEWANMRSSNSSSGWSARGGQAKNPYNSSADPCGSSTGSAIAVTTNMVAVSIGTETDGSILCPSSFNGVVGIKPTVGLTSRAGVIPISHNQDTVGPICRTVGDAVRVLEIIVGYDSQDNTTASALSFIPKDGYKQFLNGDGLNKKRLGLLYFTGAEDLLSVMRSRGAFIENLTLSNEDEIFSSASEMVVLTTDFKQDLNKYLQELVDSPVRSLADIIQFNKERASEEALSTYGQDVLVMSETTTGFDSETYKKALERDKFLTEQGLDKLFETYKLDAVVSNHVSAATLVAAAGYPAISVPGGTSSSGDHPHGIFFLGSRWSEPILIEIAYAFEQATKLRLPPAVQRSCDGTLYGPYV